MNAPGSNVPRKRTMKQMIKTVLAEHLDREPSNKRPPSFEAIKKQIEGQLAEMPEDARPKGLPTPPQVSKYWSQLLKECDMAPRRARTPKERLKTLTERPLSLQTDAERSETISLVMRARSGTITKQEIITALTNLTPEEKANLLSTVIGEPTDETDPDKLSEMLENFLSEDLATNLAGHVLREDAILAADRIFYSRKHDRKLAACLGRFFRHLEDHHNIQHEGWIGIYRDGRLELAPGDMARLALTKQEIADLRSARKPTRRKTRARKIWDVSEPKKLNIFHHLLKQHKDIEARANALLSTQDASQGGHPEVCRDHDAKCPGSRKNTKPERNSGRRNK